MGPIRMIAEFGIFFLILTLLFSSLGFLSPLLSWANKKFVYISQEQISVLEERVNVLEEIKEDIDNGKVNS